MYSAVAKNGFQAMRGVAGEIDSSDVRAIRSHDRHPQESSCATFGAGLSSACVVDIGAERTSIACVDEGLLLGETRCVTPHYTAIASDIHPGTFCTLAGMMSRRSIRISCVESPFRIMSWILIDGWTGK